MANTGYTGPGVLGVDVGPDWDAMVGAGLAARTPVHQPPPIALAARTIRLVADTAAVAHMPAAVAHRILDFIGTAR